MITAAACVLNTHEGYPVDLTAIEPYPSDILRNGFPGLNQLLVKPVQQIDRDVFSSLQANDILFIDSSHVTKVGSDVNYLFLEILPRLQPGVFVHIHDIFLPLEYPQKWILEECRFWNEQYLLQAFLACNTAFEIVWAGSYMRLKHNIRLQHSFARFDPNTVWPGSFWIRRRAE